MASKEQPFPTGLRVRFRHPRSGVELVGTTINLLGQYGLPKGQSMICADRKNEAFNDLCELAGDYRGVFVPNHYIQIREDQDSLETWGQLHRSIGVVVQADFVEGARAFVQGTTGRLLYFNGTGDGRADVSWHNMSGSKLRTEEHPNVRSGRMEVHSDCWHVPPKYLQWCRLDRNLSPTIVWPGAIRSKGEGGAEFKEGDYVVFARSKAMRVSGDRNYAVSRGTILKVVRSSNHGEIYDLVLVSGCDKRARNLPMQLTHSHIAPLEFPYIEEGSSVEIVASVEFRKRDLRGQRGMVVLPTDADGDVGIQFGENIKAGSLDGAGKSQHCLYVPVKSVEKVSE